jgi:hypothetical protein
MLMDIYRATIAGHRLTHKKTDRVNNASESIASIEIQL